MSYNSYNSIPLGRHLAVLTKLYYGALSGRLAHLELDKYYSVLIFIDKSVKPVCQQEIGDYLHIDKATMVRILDQLEKNDYLERSVSPDDRRVHRILLTEKAKAVLPEIYKAIEEINAEARKGMTAEQLKGFDEAICIMTNNLNLLPARELVWNLNKKQD